MLGLDFEHGLVWLLEVTAFELLFLGELINTVHNNYWNLHTASQSDWSVPF